METREREREMYPLHFSMRNPIEINRVLLILFRRSKRFLQRNWNISFHERNVNSFRNLLQKEKCHGVGGASCRNARVEGVNISRATAV